MIVPTADECASVEGVRSSAPLSEGHLRLDESSSRPRNEGISKMRWEHDWFAVANQICQVAKGGNLVG